MHTICVCDTNLLELCFSIDICDSTQSVTHYELNLTGRMRLRSGHEHGKGSVGHPLGPII